MSVNQLNLRDATDFELLGIYLQQSRIAAYCKLILALYLAASFYTVIPRENIAIWVTIIFLINLYVIYTSFQFNHNLPVYQIKFFRRRQHFLHFLCGLAWGSAFFLMAAYPGPVAGTYRVAAVMAVIMAVSTSSKAASYTGLIWFIVSAGCVSAWFFVMSFPAFGWWFFGVLGLMFICLMFGKMTHKYILDQVEQRLLNIGYVEELKALNEKIEKINEDFVKRNLELQSTQEQLRLLAAHDGLTGLYNRRHILERIEEKLPEVRRYQLDCCFVIMDIDYFKDVNDNYGHVAGDDVLKSVAQILVNGVRQGDIVARYGGEEFLLFLPMTDLEAAQILVERLRLAMEKYEHVIDNEMLKVTASFGIAQHEIHDSADKTIARADKALYDAKVAGRNRIVVSPNP